MKERFNQTYTMTFRAWSFCCAVLLLMASHAYSQVVVEMKLDTVSILVGEQVMLSTSVSADAGSNVSYPSYKAGSELVKGVEVVSQTDVDTALLNNGKRIRLSRNYTITAFDSALYTLPQFSVAVGTDTFTSPNTVGLKVDLLPVDTAALDKFAGPHGVVPETFFWRYRLLFMSLIIWLILGFVILISIKLTRRKPLSVRKIVKPQIPPYKQAVTALGGMSSNVAGDADSIKRYYVQLTDILRVYIQRRFRVLAMEKTTDEVLPSLRDVVDEAKWKDLESIFRMADLVKFAKFQPSDMERSRCLSMARSFLDDTVDDSMEHPEPIVEIVQLNDGMQKKYRTMLWTALVVLVLGGIAYIYYVDRCIFETFF